MDFKLNKMKKILFLTILFLILSCSTYKRTRFEYNLGSKKNEWINNFKTEFFFTCLKKGYDNDTIFKLIAKKDFQYLYEPFAYQHNKIDSLALKIIQNIPKPIIPHCDDCTKEEEIEELKKNYICATCLNYYASYELDSITRVTYRKLLKDEKVLEKFWRKK